jgi:hypothetical protein
VSTAISTIDEMERQPVNLKSEGKSSQDFER